MFFCVVCGGFRGVSAACTACSSAYQQSESDKDSTENYDEVDQSDEIRSMENAVFGPNGGNLIFFDNDFAVMEIILDPEEGVLYALPMEPEVYEPISLETDELEIKIFAMTWFSQEAKNQDFPLILGLKPLQFDWDGEMTKDRSQFELEHEDLKEVMTFEGIISRIEIGGREFKNVGIKYFPSFVEE
jgi:hypothetical protein